MPHTLVDISQLHPCAGAFLNGFEITSETTRADVVSAARCGNHHIDTASGQSVHDLWCIDCGIWIGDVNDSAIAHVSIPLGAECRPSPDDNFDDTPCPACKVLLTAGF